MSGSLGLPGSRGRMLAALTVCLVVVAGCGAPKTSSTAGTPSAGGTNSAPSPPATETPPAKKDIVIGFSQRRVAGSDWYKTLIQGVEEHAKRNGATIKVLDAGGDTVRQNSDIRTLIAQKVDVVIINANDPRGIAPAVKELKEAKIPFVAVNSNLDQSLHPDAYCYVAEDQVATAALAGREMARIADEKFKPGEEVKIVTIGGYSGDIISDLRESGFWKGWDAYWADKPNEKVKVNKLPTKYGEWLPDRALAPTRDVATANPDLKIVFSESDVMHAGIKQGLKQAGLWGQVLIATYDGGMDVVKEMIDSPTGPVLADASNQPYDQGVAAVEMALAAVKGTPKDQVCPGGTKYVETVVVTPQNARTYYDSGKTFIQSYGVKK